MDAIVYRPFKLVSNIPTLNIGLIGGTDSSGGAGTVADKQTVIDLGHKPIAVISAITLQNTNRGIRIFEVPKEGLNSQFSDLIREPVHGLKIGMLPNANAVETVSKLLQRQKFFPVVLDPVFQSSSGYRLIDQEGWNAIKHILLPQVDLVTPNLLEAKKMLCLEHDNPEPSRLAEGWLGLGTNALLIKGGHGKGECSIDFLYDKEGQSAQYRWKRIEGGTSIRGTGCRLSTAITCHWGMTNNLEQSIRMGGEYLQQYLGCKTGSPT